MEKQFFTFQKPFSKTFQKRKNNVYKIVFRHCLGTVPKKCSQKRYQKKRLVTFLWNVYITLKWKTIFYVSKILLKNVSKT